VTELPIGDRGTFVKKSCYNLTDIIDAGEGKWGEMGLLARNKMRLISGIPRIETTGKKDSKPRF